MRQPSTFQGFLCWYLTSDCELIEKYLSNGPTGRRKSGWAAGPSNSLDKHPPHSNPVLTHWSWGLKQTHARKHNSKLFYFIFAQSSCKACWERAHRGGLHTLWTHYPNKNMEGRKIIWRILSGKNECWPMTPKKTCSEHITPNQAVGLKHIHTVPPNSSQDVPPWKGMPHASVYSWKPEPTKVLDVHWRERSPNVTKPTNQGFCPCPPSLYWLASY